MKKALLLLLMMSSLACYADEDAKPALEKVSSSRLSSVRKVIKDHLLEVQKCYTDLIIEGMEMRGKVVVTWDVDDKGAAQNVAVKENTANQTALSGCVTEKLQNWGFPTASAGKIYQIEYPFKFGG